MIPEIRLAGVVSIYLAGKANVDEA